MKAKKTFWDRFRGSPALMAACCVLLLAGGAGLFLTGVGDDWALYGLLLLCPIVHLLLMKDHRH